MLAHIKNTFGNKVRVRVMGILEEDEKVLLLKHAGIGKEHVLWLPPGGGVDFGTSLEETLIKEFREETNLSISVENFMFIHEYIKGDLHAIEFFYRVSCDGGQVKLGSDPELRDEDQILADFAFFSKEELVKMPKTHLHGAFHASDPIKEFHGYSGIITFDY